MQKRLHYLIVTLSISVLLLIIGSCSREDDDPFSDNSYLISAEKVFSTSTANITNLLTILSATNPDIGGLTGYVKHNIDVWRITYKTELYGEEIVASGLISVPASPGTYPVLSFQNGTNTQHSNAPSVYPASFSYLLIEDVASMGFMVIIPDYPGFGSSQNKVHPYLLKEPTIRSVKDMLEAAREFDDDVYSQADINEDLYLFGYSQGGWATLALHHDLEMNGTDSFILKAAAAGAGPADLNLILEGLISADEYPMPSYFAYIAFAYRTYGSFQSTYSDLFKEPYATKIPGLFNGLLSTGSINAELTTNVAALLNPAFIAGFETSPLYEDVRQALRLNSITGWKTTVPLLLVHGEADTQVPASGTVSFYNEMISAGTLPSVLQMEMIPGADHGTGLIPASVRSLLFLIELMENNR
jgi:alpha-beta hydrolase superfamily lysophospholipase